MNWAIWIGIVIFFFAGVSSNNGVMAALSVVAACAWGLILLNRQSKKKIEVTAGARPIRYPSAPVPSSNPIAMKHDAFNCKNCGAQNPAGFSDSPVCDFCGAASPLPKTPAVPAAAAAAPKVVQDDNIGVSSFGQVCCSCRTYVSVPKKEMPGSTGVEVLLWFFYIIPGIFYSMWRRNEDNWKPVCMNCQGKDFVPVSSPDGRRFFEAKYGRRPRFD